MKKPRLVPPAAKPGVVTGEWPAHGHYRIFLRTDGKYIVYDDTKPLAQRAVWTGAALEGAQLAAERLAAGVAP